MDDRGNCSTDNLVMIPGSLNLSVRIVKIITMSYILSTFQSRSLSQNVLVSPQSVQIKLRLGMLSNCMITLIFCSLEMVNVYTHIQQTKNTYLIRFALLNS